MERARDACVKLRWHKALRRRHDECRLEGQVRAAQASVALEGVNLPVEVVRDLARGALDLSDDPAQRFAVAALRVQAQIPRLAVDQARAARVSLPQALATLHLAAATGLVDNDRVGRPRHDEPRLTGLGTLLRAGLAEPAPVLAAVITAEVESMGLFPGVDGLIARALGRIWLEGSGVDPMGLALAETSFAADPTRYAASLAGYRSGSAAGLVGWVVTFCEGVAAGAVRGSAVCDDVAMGRLP